MLDRSAQNKDAAKSDASDAETIRRANQRSRGTRNSLVFAILALVVIGVVGFGGWTYINRDQPDTVLTVGAGPRGTDSYQLMSDISQVVARHADGVQLRVLATAGSSQNVQLLNSGAVDMATIGAGTPVVNDIRLVSHLFSDFFVIVTRADTGIKRFKDLRGKLIGLPPDGSDGLKAFWTVSDHYDLQVQTVKFRSNSFQPAYQSLLAGELDAIFRLSSLRDRQLLRLFEDAELTNVELEVVTIDQAQAIALARPFLVVEEIPRGTFTGAFPSPRWNMNVPTIRRNLVSRSDVDAEAIGEITRVLFEHRLDLVTRDSLAGGITQPDTSIGLTLPLHEGSEAFFNRDQPTYLQENAEPLALGVTITAMLISTLIALRSRLAKGQKNRADKYNYQLLDIAERSRIANDAASVMLLQDELNDVLQTVVIALDTDEVTDEGFQSFSLLWESVRRQLSERRQEFSA